VSNYEFYKSTDKGKNWHRSKLPPRDWHSIINSTKQRLGRRSHKKPPFPTALDNDAHQSSQGGNNWGRIMLRAWGWQTILDSVSHGWQKIGQYYQGFSYILSKNWTIRPHAIVVSPGFAADNTIYVVTERNRIFRSVDGGIQWSVIWQGELEESISLAISPDFASDNTLYAGITNKGIYKTTDRGNTWQAVYSSPTSRHVAVSPHYTIDGTVFASTTDSLIKTADRGQTWEKMKDIYYGGENSIENIAISPNYNKDNTMIISLKGKRAFFSNDLMKSNNSFSTVKFSPAYAIDNTLYGVSGEELFRSTDSGRTWTLVKRSVRGGSGSNRQIIQHVP
jgi:hypothetical protein